MRSARGFTLIELIVVLTIVAILAAGVVPIYQGSLTWTRRDQMTREFVASMKFAQERAISDGVECRFYLDEKQNTFWTARLAKETGNVKEFTVLDETAPGKRHLPEGLTMPKPKAKYDKDAKAYYVAFYPNGACDYAHVTLKSGNKLTFDIDTKGRIGQFEVIQK